MTVGRGTLGRLQALIAKARASLPPFFAVIQRREGETPKAFEARKAKARARGAVFIIVDREEDGA